MDKPKILLVSQGAAATGFSRVSDSLMGNLSNDFDCYQLALNQRQSKLPGSGAVFGNPDPMDAYGIERILELIQKLSPQLLLIFNDPWFCCMQIDRIKACYPRLITIAYCPVDGELTRPEIYRALAHFDHLVAYSAFGKKELEKIWLSERSTEEGTIRTIISIIPHGINSHDFFPLDRSHLINRKIARAQLFGEAAGSIRFLVLNASKHQPRKRIDLSIRGFAEFARDKEPGVRLYLHTCAFDGNHDLRQLIREEGIEERVLHSKGWLNDHPAIENDALNLLYNAADIGINTSVGEGWGLVSFEHAATGAPQLVPDHSACSALWNASDGLLPSPAVITHDGLGMSFRATNAHEIAARLNRLYENETFRLQQANACFAIATNPLYSWASVSDCWKRLIGELIFPGKINATGRWLK